MPRDIPVGNGTMLVAFDRDYQLREFYFPHVGEENHAGNEPFRFGVWRDGAFRWLPDGWKITKDYLDDSLVTDVELVSEVLQVRIRAHDCVDFHENVFVRKVTVENLSGKEADIRVFFAHDFHILGNAVGDTACFRPEANGMLHYKGGRYFLINIFAHKKYGIDHFAAGNKENHDLEGAWKDAEDGVLSGNPIAQGAVDSVIAVQVSLKPKEQETFYYWICAGRNWDEVSAINRVVQKKSPEILIQRTRDYWKLWVDKEGLNYSLLPEKLVSLYKRSLLIARTQIDNNGSIIAGNDSGVVYFNRDTYSYMWPRDGALAAYALDKAGYAEITRKFFELCAGIIEKDGYFLHKYTPSGVLASSWHPWQSGRKTQLPIQEDETALVVWALWNHFKRYKDIEFIKPLYKPLIKNAADFMMGYRDTKTGLPLESYDIWEERQGVCTFTVSAVYGGLMAASYFAAGFGESEIAEEYRRGAQRMREAMDSFLYLKKEKRFARMLVMKKDRVLEVDATVDASLYGIFAFGAYSADDEKVRTTMEQVYERLWCGKGSGGLARYENDPYYRVKGDVPGNPWFVTTLWLAQYYIARAKNKKDLQPALEIMEWARQHALPSCVLAEQVDPFTNEPLSVSPLTWSHAAYIAVVQEYLDTLIGIETCKSCGHPRLSKNRPADKKN